MSFIQTNQNLTAKVQKPLLNSNASLNSEEKTTQATLPSSSHSKLDEENTNILNWVNQLKIKLEEETTNLEILAEQGLKFSKKFQFEKKNFTIQQNLKNQILVKQSDFYGETWLEQEQQDQLLQNLKKQYMTEYQDKIQSEFQKQQLENIDFGLDSQKQKKDQEYTELEQKVQYIDELLMVTDQQPDIEEYSFQDQINVFASTIKQLHEGINEDSPKQFEDYLEDLMNYLEEKDGDFYELLLEKLEDYDELQDFLENLEYDYDFELEDEEYDYDFEDILQNLQKSVAEIKSSQIQTELSQVQNIKQKITMKKTELQKLKLNFDGNKEISEKDLLKLQDLVSQQEKKTQEAYQNISDKGNKERREKKFLDTIKMVKYDTIQENEYLQQGLENIQKTEQNLLKAKESIAQKSTQKTLTETIQQFWLEMENTVNDELTKNIDSTYTSTLSEEITKQQQKIDEIIKNQSKDTTFQEQWQRQFQEQFHKVLKNQQSGWLPATKEQQSQKTYKNRFVQQDLDSKSINLQKEIALLQQNIAGQSDLLDNTTTGYNISQKKSLIRYQEALILNTLTNIDDKDKLNSQISSLQQQKTSIKNSEISTQYSQKQQQLTSINNELKQSENLLKNQQKSLIYKTLKNLKQKQDNNEYFDVQADYFIEQIDKIYTEVIPAVVKYDEEKGKNSEFLTTLKSNCKPNISDFSAYEPLIQAIYDQYGKVVCLKEISFNFSKTSDQTVLKITTYNGEFNVEISDKLQQISQQNLEKDAQILTNAFQVTYEELFGASGLELQKNLENSLIEVLEKRKSQRNLEKFVTVFNVSEENQPLIGKKMLNNLQNNIDLAIKKVKNSENNSKNKDSPFEVVIRQTGLNPQQIHTDSDHIVQEIYQFLIQNQNKFAQQIQNILSKIDQEKALKFFQQWVSDIYKTEKKLDLDDVLLNQDENNDLCLLFAIYFEKSNLLEKMTIFDQMGRKILKKQQEKLKIESEISLLKLQKEQQDQKSETVSDLLKILSEKQPEDKKKIFKNMAKYLKIYQDQYTQTIQNLSKKHQENQNHLIENQEEKEKFQFKIDQNELENVENEIISYHFVFKYIILSQQPWVKIPNSDNEDQLFQLQTVRDLIEIISKEVESGNIQLEIKLKQFKIDQLYTKLKEKVGEKANYLSNIMKIVCIDIKDGLKALKNQELQQIDQQFIQFSYEKNRLEQLQKANSDAQTYLNEKTDIVEQYLEFLKNPEKKETLDEYKDLMKYQQQLLKSSLAYQSQQLVKFLSYLIENLLNPLENQQSKQNLLQIVALFFKNEYFQDLDISNPQNLPEKIEQKLENLPENSPIYSELKRNYNSTNWLQSLLQRLESTLNEAPESKDLLNQINGKLHKKDKEIDLYQVYTLLLNQEILEKQALQAQKIKKAETELTTLQQSLKETYLKDYSVLKFQKQCSDDQIFYLENKTDMQNLQERIENTKRKDLKTNLFGFRLCNDQAIVQLNREGLEAQEEEKKEILRAKDLIEKNYDNISKKKGQKEIYSNRLDDIQQEKYPKLLKLVQRILITEGLILTGFSQFENKEALDQVDSFIAVVIDRILQDDSLFQYGGLNQTSSELQGRVKKIKINLKGKLSRKKQLKIEDYKQILSHINQEYLQDGFQIKAIQLKEQAGKPIINIQDSSISNGMNLVLVKIQGQYYGLQSVQKWKMNKNNENSDILDKLSYFHSILQQDQTLFQEVGRQRLNDILEESYELSENFVQGYKKEVQKADKILSLDEFTSQICKFISPNDTLFTYLTTYQFLQKKIETIKQNNPQETLILPNENQSPTDFLKSLYKKNLLNLAVQEQIRRKKTSEKQSESTDQEQKYWQDQLEEAEKQKEELEKQIQEHQSEMTETEKKLQKELEKKKKEQEKFEQKIENLQKSKDDLKSEAEESRKKLEELLKKEDQNKQEIEKTKAEIEKKETEIKEKDQELQEQKKIEEKLSQEIKELSDKSDRITLDKLKKEAQKQKLNSDLEDKQQDITACNCFITIQKNLEKMLKIYENYQKRQEITKYICNCTSLQELIEKGKEESNKKYWDQLINTIEAEDLSVFADYVNKKKEFFGFDIYKMQEILNKNADYLISITITPEEDLSSQKLELFKVKVPIVSYSYLYTSVKAKVEKEMQKKQSGLSFDSQDLLHCSTIDKLQNLPQKLLKLVLKRIELKYLNTSYETDTKKTAEQAEAVKIINELQIKYEEVIHCFVDEIFIIADKFFLDPVATQTENHFPGVDFSLNCTDLEVLKDSFINVSGLKALEFENKYAAKGEQLRKDAKVPKGQKGVDGYDGQDGMNSGNIVLKIENSITNQDFLEVKAEGGDGGKGQFGGDGDQGLKGEMGKKGNAPNTSGMGGKQICIGFGTKGEVGGDGGAPGRTGRPGRGGFMGEVNIQVRDLDLSEKIIIDQQDGVEGDNILDENNQDPKPKAGIPGQGGLPGFDEIRTKPSFFKKTTTNSKTYIDMGKLVQYCKDNGYESEIPKVKARKNIRLTNDNFLLGFIVGIGVSLIVLTAIIATGGIAAVTLPGIAMGLMAFAMVGMVGGFLAGIFGSALETEEMKEFDSLRNSEKKQNSTLEKTALRNDEREQQDEKRQERNTESMHKEYKELQDEKSEVFKQDIFNQYMQKIENDKVSLDQEINETQNSIDILNGELEQISQEKTSKTVQKELVSKAIDRISQELKTVQEELKEQQEKTMQLTEEGKKIRDQKREEQQHLQQIINQLNKISEQGLEYSDIKKELSVIVDQYTAMLQQKLQQQKSEMKQLKEELEMQIQASQEFKNKIKQMEKSKEIQKMMQQEIQRAQEQLQKQMEIDVQEEKGNPTDVDIPSNFKGIKPPSELPYVKSPQNLYDNLKLNFKDLQSVKSILFQSLRYFRASNVTLETVTTAILNPLKEEEQNAQKDEEVQQILEQYTKDLEEIQLKIALESLPETEKMLFQNTIQRIHSALEQDEFKTIDQQYQQSFLFTILELESLKIFPTILNLKNKIQARKDDLYYLKQDNILEDTSRIMQILGSSHYFYLEQICQHEKEDKEEENQPSELENSLTQFNKSQTLEELLSLAKQYKKSCQFFEKSAFFNLKNLFSVEIVYAIKEEQTSKREDKSNTQSIKKTFNDTLDALIKSSSFLSQDFTAIKSLTDAIQNLSKQALQNSENRKKANKIIKNLQKITLKLLSYVPDAKFSELSEKYCSQLQIYSKFEENILETEYLNTIQDIEDKILYQNEDKEHEKEPSEVDPDENPLNDFVKEWVIFLEKAYSSVEIMQKSEIESFLIQLYVSKSLALRPKKEQKQIIQDSQNTAYFTAHIGIFRTLTDEYLSEISAILGYKLDKFKALIQVNLFNSELFEKIEEKMPKIIKKITENDQENPFKLTLDLEYQVLISQSSLENFKLDKIQYKFQSRYKRLGNKVDVEKIGKLIADQSMSSSSSDNDNDNDKRTIEDKIFEKLDFYMPFTLIQVLLQLEKGEIVQNLIKSEFGEAVLDLKSVNTDSALYGKIEKVVLQDCKGLDEFLAKFQEKYHQKTQISLDLGLFYQEKEYEIAMTLLEKNKLSVKTLEKELNSSDLQAGLQRIILTQEYDDRCTLETEQMDTYLNTALIFKEEKQAQQAYLTQIQTDLQIIIKINHLLQLNPGFYNSLSLYKALSENILLNQSNLKKLAEYIAENKQKQVQKSLKHLFNKSFESESQEQLFSVLIQDFKDCFSGKRNQNYNDLASVFYHLSLCISEILAKSSNQRTKIITELYSLVDFMSQQNNESEEELIKTKQEILKQAEMMTLESTFNSFNSLKKQENEKILALTLLKAEIKQEFASGAKVILDKIKRKNYKILFTLYLEKLDILIAEGDDIACKKRIGKFNEFKEKIAKLDSNKQTKYLDIEDLLADFLDDYIFTKDNEKFQISSEFLEKTLKELENLELKIAVEVTDLKDKPSRLLKNDEAVKIAEFFDSFGQIDAKSANFEENLKKLVVVTKIDPKTSKKQDICFKYPQDSFEDTESALNFISDLKTIYDLEQFTKLAYQIKKWNSQKPNRIRLKYLLEGLQYYLLRAESEKTEQKDLLLLSNFSNSIVKITENILFTKEKDFETLKKLRASLDLFLEHILKPTLDITTDNLKNPLSLTQRQILQSFQNLRSEIVYKSYKERNLRNVVEESEAFQEQTEQKQQQSTLTSKLEQIWENLLQLVLNRIELGVNDKGKVYEELGLALNSNNFQGNFDQISQENIVKITEFVENYENTILIKSLDKDVQTPEEYLSKINKGEIYLLSILSDQDQKKREKNLKSLKLILEKSLKNSENDGKTLINNDKIKEFVLKLNSENDQEFAFIQNLMVLFTDNNLKQIKKKYSEEILSSQLIEQAYSNIFSAFSTKKNNCDQDSLELIFKYLDLISVKISQKIDENTQKKANLKEDLQIIVDQIEIEFITSNMGLVSDKISASFNEKYQNLQKEEEKQQFLTLISLLPESFFKEEKEENDFKNLIKTIISDFQSQNNEFNSDFFNSILKLILLFTKLNFPNFLKQEEEQEELEVDEWKVLDNQFCLISLSENLKQSEFLTFITQNLLERQNLSEKSAYNYTITVYKNTVIQDQDSDDLSFIIPFLSKQEQKSLKQLLKSQQKEQETLEICLKQRENENLIKQLKPIFHDPKSSWNSSLNGLGFYNLSIKILDNADFDSKNTETLQDVIEAFQFLSKQQQQEETALEILKGISENVSKFGNSLEQVKRSIEEICYWNLKENKENLFSLLLNQDKIHITYDILFSRISVDNNEALKNALLKLKIALSEEDFVKVEIFCKVFSMKFQQLDNSEGVAEVVEYIIKSRLYVKESLLKSIKEKEFLSWKQDLQKEIIRVKLNLTKFRYFRFNETEKMVELLYQIQDKKGIEFFNELFDSVLREIEDIKIKRVISQLNKILHSNLNDVTDLNRLRDDKGKIIDVQKWDDNLYPKIDTQADTDPLTVPELLEIMQEGDKIKPQGFNYSRKEIILKEKPIYDLEGIVEKALDVNTKITEFSHLSQLISDKHVKEWKKEDCTAWANAYNRHTEYHNIELFNMYNSKFNKQLLIETLRVIGHGVHLFNSWYPRKTNLISIILYFANREGKVGSLANIETGEGKTSITIVMAIMHALCGLSIDVLTSSKVLAIRDSQNRDPITNEGWREFYGWFGVKCNNNCDKECEDPRKGDQIKKERYGSCQVIYGEAGYFQRDILLTDFFGKGIRSGKSTADVIILDEVDNMMIDNAVKTLYISHRINDFRHLRDVFIRIWVLVNGKDGAYTEDNITKVEKHMRQILHVLDEVMIDFDSLKATIQQINQEFPDVFCGQYTGIEQFLAGETKENEVQLVNNQSITRQDLVESIMCVLKRAENSKYSKENAEILLIKLGLEQTELQLQGGNSLFIPKTLQEFVDKSLRSWIENAYYAKFLQLNDTYIIGDNDSAGPGKAIIMDKDTGVEQNSTKWSKGLHQFIQLKHNLKLSDESLKAVYMSNLNYFKKYKKLYGMSGTVGDKDERSLIADTYKADFFQIPRFKKYRFLYEADVESVAANTQEWLQNIVENIDENIDQNIEYTEEYKKDLQKSLENFEKKKQKALSTLTDLLNLQTQQESELTTLTNTINALKQIESLSFQLIETNTQDLSFQQKLEQVQSVSEQIKTEIKTVQNLESILGTIQSSSK